MFPSSEIYDGLSATYDYGPYGAELKNNIRQYWWAAMTKLNENIVGLDAAIFMHPTVWKASGHVDAFNDPLIDNKDSEALPRRRAAGGPPGQVPGQDREGGGEGEEAFAEGFNEDSSGRRTRTCCARRNGSTRWRDG